MEYVSNNRNIVVSADEDFDHESRVGSASISITYPELIEIQRNDESSSLDIRCKASTEVVASVDASITEIDDWIANKPSHMSRRRVRLRSGAHKSTSYNTHVSSVFKVSIDGKRDFSVQRLHPMFETLLMDAIIRRKREDEEATRSFLKSKQAAFLKYEEILKEEALALSQIALNDASSKQTSQSELKAPTQIPNPVVRKRTPMRSATTPVPKSALVPPGRRTSLNVSTQASDHSTPKRVMFAESAPVRIESPRVESSDDEPEQEELFSMDETIPLGPFVEPEEAESEKSPTTEHIEFQSSPFATSLPRNIDQPFTKPNEPIYSVKDITTAIPMDDLNLNLQPLLDSPPKDMDRGTIWKLAVADSLRMSGLVMPTQSY